MIPMAWRVGISRYKNDLLIFVSFFKKKVPQKILKHIFTNGGRGNAVHKSSIKLDPYGSFLPFMRGYLSLFAWRAFLNECSKIIGN